MPTIHFTVKSLDAIKAPTERPSAEYWDSSKPGFGLRVSAGGRKVWIVRYKVRNTGDHDRATLGLYESMALADARLAASEYLDAAQRGFNLRTQKEEKRVELERKKAEAEKTFGWLANKYLNDPEVLRKRSFREDKRILEGEVLEFWKKPGTGWAKRHLGTITKADVRELLESTLKRTQAVRNGKPGKGIHANRVFSRIRRVFNYGLEKDLISLSPCHGMKRPLKHEPSRDHVLTLDGLRTIWRVLEAESELNRCHPDLTDDETMRPKRALIAILKLMALTAQRGAEVRSMAWADLDLESSLWKIPGEKTKNRKTHTVPLSSQAVEIVSTFLPYRDQSPWVFSSSVDSMKHIEHFQKAIQRFRESSGVAWVGHDLRRTAASHMAAIGVAHHIIKHILNHSDGKDITEVYNRYAYESEKREALQRWGDYLYQVVTKGSEMKVVPLSRARNVGQERQTAST